MKRVIMTAARYPWLVFTILSVVTLVAAIQLTELRIEISAEGMMINHAEAVADYRNSLLTFGSEAITVVYLEDDDLMAPRKLTAIREALRRIEALPHVSHAVSLFSIRYLRTQNGYIYSSPYLETIPNSKDSARQITDAALLNPLIERNLLSRDGTVMAINLYLDMTDYHHGFDESFTKSLDNAITPLQVQLRRVFHLGNPSIRTGISDQIRNDLRFTLPLSIIVLILTLWLILKRPSLTLIPLITAGLSVIWTLGAMAFLSIPVNVMTSIIPVLLIIIGSTEDIHLISEYQSGIRNGLKQLDATYVMASHKGTAILLTFSTTCLGFLSISLNRIDLLQQFGLITAIGLTLNFIITVTLVPACLQLISPHYGRNFTAEWSVLIRLVETTFSWIERYPRKFVLSLILLIAFNIYWATRIEINNNVMAYLPYSSPLPEQAGLIRDNLSGIESLAILVSGSDEAFLKTSNLQQLRQLQRHLEKLGHFDKSFSFADFISVVHSGIDGEETDKIHLPESDELVSSYMSLLGHSSAKAFVSPDFNQARIIVRHAIDGSRQLNREVEEIIRFADEFLDPSLEVKVTGSSCLNSQAVDYMADGQTRSLLLLLGVIFLLITLLLANAKIGFVAVASNLFPIITLFGVMGCFGIVLDTGTVMVAAIALGLSVDHTMHFVVHYQRLLREGTPHLISLLQTIRGESTPIFTTALALIMGFSILAFSAFPPVALFGLLSALVMLTALIGTFVVTPLLLNLTEPTARTSMINRPKRQVYIAKAHSRS
ncbi:MAG: MMPL family transporter [Candidatus Thiodiazotropha sp. (ex Monitilora ramsayi)]|nr:MMPL family transporter [Candidatus Thiodiazotropha sp. (ex Monitilora ramsayi)]